MKMYNYHIIEFNDCKSMDNKPDKYSNKEIAELLRSIAAVYLLKGEIQFRIIAYEKAADTVEHLNRELRDIWQEGRILEVPGIGSSIGSHLDEYFRKGRSRHFDSVLKKVPNSMFVLMKVPTIGPKKAYKLVMTLKLFNAQTVINDLKKACLDKKIETISSFGAKSQEDILNAINIYEQKFHKVDRMPLPYAFSLANEIIKYLKTYSGVKRVDALGSLRRMVSSIGDIDIALTISNYRSKGLVEYFLKYPKSIREDNAGEKKASIIVRPNIRVDLRVEPEKSYGSMLQYFTGSKAHNINLREFALKKGYSLSEYGIKPGKKVQNSKFPPSLKLRRTSKVQNKSQFSNFNKQKNLFEFSNEINFYNFLGLQYIPPEIREGTNEIELASKNKIPNLVELRDVKGDLHIHSSYDLKPSHDLGMNSYLELLEQARKLNYEYVGFADHNPKMSNLNINENLKIMRKRKEYIDKTCKKYGKVKYFIGLEVDIQPDGKISLPIKALDFVDYIIVSVHSVFNMDIDTMTNRILKALTYPKVKILGHPTGRLLGKRDGYQLEWKKIFEFCTKKDIAIEINAWPERLDLPDSLVHDALSFNAKFIINTDAHAISQMANMFYGVSVARRGWCIKNDIMNTLSHEKFKKWLFI